MDLLQISAPVARVEVGCDGALLAAHLPGYGAEDYWRPLVVQPLRTFPAFYGIQGYLTILSQTNRLHTTRYYISVGQLNIIHAPTS